MYLPTVARRDKVNRELAVAEPLENICRIVQKFSNLLRSRKLTSSATHCIYSVILAQAPSARKKRARGSAGHAYVFERRHAWQVGVRARPAPGRTSTTLLITSSS